MRTKTTLLIAIFALVALLTACNKEKPEDVEEPAQSLPSDVQEDDYKEVIKPHNELSFALFQKIRGSEEQDLFISPTSLFLALSMVYNGAEGETKEEMAQALQLAGIDEEKLNKASASLVNQLQKDDESIQLDIANSIWLNEQFHFQEGFKEKTQDYFKAEIEEINIQDDASVDQINKWVSEATNDKIDKMVEAPLDPNLVTYLLNAIYFKGDWTYEFDEKETEKADFHITQEEEKEVSMMSLSEDLLYTENDLFQAVELPYGEESMKMQVFLPKEEVKREEVAENFTFDNWTKWNQEFETSEGTVKLPKFELSYEIMLNEILQQLGMELAFKKEAEFTKLIEEEEPVWISSVKQKTFIEVHEKGTEAAAVTGVEVVSESAPIDDPFLLEANRPFIITIVDEETDAILFMGEIVNPEEAN